MGFVHPEHEGMIKSLGVALDQRGNVRANTADPHFGEFFSSYHRFFSGGFDIIF